MAPSCRASPSSHPSSSTIDRSHSFGYESVSRKGLVNPDAGQFDVRKPTMNWGPFTFHTASIQETL